MQNKLNVIPMNNTRSPMERLRENAVLLSVVVRCPSFKKTDKRAGADHSRSRNAR